jgi:hypothetical protein
MIFAFWNLSAETVMRSELAPFNQYAELERTPPRAGSNSTAEALLQERG